tara:strand:- start:5704 stop:6132 length:429 start_codon:yes stop_codon:yes gene_type:complete
VIITRNSVDFHWSQDGDFSLGPNGDIKRANHEGGRVARQTIMKRLQSSLGDWVLHPDIGASLSHFAGLPNNRQTGALIKAKVVSTLMDEGAISGSSLKVEVVPIAKNKVLVLVYATIAMSGEPVFINMQYDLRENKMIPRLV